MEKLKFKIKIIDNFLSNEDYVELCNLNIDKNLDKGFTVYHNEINEKEIITSAIDESLLKKLHNNYHDKAINILKDLCPEKLPLYDYSDFTVIVTSKNSKFPIHDDTPNKILSGVIYLSPEKNSGTTFYNDKTGSDRTEMEWKKNRAVFFSRRERETWHSYKGDNENNRVALVYNLMTKNIKKVYEIEKKNYYLGMMRWKVNPYLFRYLKTYY